ncbi:hypothetical protein CRU87_06120 [Aliarcobacter trophiarum LMG 25534]|uniref:Uncharacterized protein n=1 Tax=Aliarcobacter trophiarum LMG 25534 TaxID=1032241 RepID=A0AAD0QL94_9BACT|nr:hypothetical protein [Aliarcobacter trophiarum]AXK49493.1 hypothetical protein ATR_1665 [Aliarcobacter trophiarum LMG 25534]RXI27957.1 hypothetical protein CRU89_04005 [Aliarcobacter trophiarum]RXJ91265.1 hypothetical protein CRU87_06120 [Aliarcobacter trophiarum LMG 25534]
METTNKDSEEQVIQNSEEQEEAKRDKTLLIKKILFAVIGILIIFLIILILLFIFKDDKDDKVQNEVLSSIEKTENIVENITQEEEISEKKFDFNNLEPEKLNEQLELLTNKNLEYQKEKEQKLLEEEKKLSPVFNLVNNLKDKNEGKEELPLPLNEANSIEESKKNDINNKENLTILNKDEDKKQVESIKDEIQIISQNSTQTDSLEFLKLINVAKIKGNLNKKYLDKIVIVNADILLCRDDENIIELYYGPFLEDSIRDNLLSSLLKNGFKEAYSLEMTKEEFDKRCNY